MEAKREAYEQARGWLALLIDNPDKSVPVSDYQTQILVARLNVANTHKSWMASIG